MALDKQKILNELESVVHQLQSANCGCLGNVFNNQQVSSSQPQMMGFNTPHGCGHSNHVGTCGHSQGGAAACGEPCHNGQAHGNCTHHHPSNVGSAAQSHFDPALVQPIVKEVYEELKTMTPENTFVNSPIANQMGLPVAKGPHHLPNPCNGTNIPDMQKAMEDAKVMQAMGNKFMNAVNNQNTTNNTDQSAYPNSPKVAQPPMYNVMQCQNCRVTAAPVQQITNNGLGQVCHSNSNVIPNNPQQMVQNHSPYGQHAQGMAKFQELFPGVMGNGDLGFDPMAVAIKMNPNNQGTQNMAMRQSLNTFNQANNAIPCPHLTAPLQQSNVLHPNIPNINMPLANPNIPLVSATAADTPKVHNSNNGLYPNEQQVYQTTPRQQISQVQPSSESALLMHRPFHPATEKLMNEVLPGSQPSPKLGMCEHVHTPVPLASQPQGQKLEYNTLGQPVEILPAEIFHKPEECLPQTLSPQPNSSNQPGSPMNASMNKEFVVNNIASNKTPCMMANAMSYGTHSAGQLNMNHQKNVNSFVERTVGDTAVNNYKSPRPQVDLHAGDKPDIAQPVAGVIEKLSPNSERKHRNGLQDIVYTSYPKSTKWSFHGNARKTQPPGQRPT